MQKLADNTSALLLFVQRVMLGNIRCNSTEELLPPSKDQCVMSFLDMGRKNSLHNWSRRSESQVEVG